MTFIVLLDYSHGDHKKIREKLQPEDDNTGHITGVWSLILYVFTPRFVLKKTWLKNFEARKARKTAKPKKKVEVVRGPHRIEGHWRQRQKIARELAEYRGTEKQGELIPCSRQITSGQ